MTEVLFFYSYFHERLKDYLDYPPNQISPYRIRLLLNQFRIKKKDHMIVIKELVALGLIKWINKHRFEILEPKKKSPISNNTRLSMLELE